MPRPLTAQQQRVLTTLHRLAQHQSRAPSRRELSRILGYRSANSVQRHLKELARRGYVEVDVYKWHGVRLVADDRTVVEVPLVGNVACGQPLWAEENIEDHIPIQRELLHGHLNGFLLRAKGDSMNLAGIEDGDLLLIDGHSHALTGELVVALIDGEATVKVYRAGGKYAVLVPKSSNAEHRPIIVKDDFTIQGRVRGIFKLEDLVA